MPSMGCICTAICALAAVKALLSTMEVIGRFPELWDDDPTSKVKFFFLMLFSLFLFEAPFLHPAENVNQRIVSKSQDAQGRHRR